MHWIMDYETLNTCFVAVFQMYDTSPCEKVFVISKFRNDYDEFINFLENTAENDEYHISFNGLGFDAQISEYLLKTRDTLKDLFPDPEDMAHAIYEKAQATINKQEFGEWAEYPEWKLSTKQIDVFKLNHWDNPAKRSSLKWIEYTMDWHNIQEMPIHHNYKIKTQEELDIIIQYCINDVRATREIMNRSKGQIMLRKGLSEEYGINLMSASEPRISRELFAYFLSKKIGIPKYQLKELRTRRDTIRIGDLILPYTKFSTDQFKGLLDRYSSLEINAKNTKGGFKHKIKYKGVDTDFGLGGVHGVRDAGVYKSGEGKTIMTSDVVSFYPNLAIRNRWSPAHLPQKDFCELYEWFFEERKKIPKKDPKNYVYKIILNSTYGLSNDENSFLYDPEFTMRVTINGQLTLMMLYEMLAEGIPGAYPLMQNTDGLEMIIPVDQKENYLKICKEWEKITNLQLEHDEYSKMVVADVNNYIAISKTGKAKCKGRFEFEELALHKNKSFLIVPKALYAYFIHDIMPEKFLAENRNIMDYCGGSKSKGEWKFTETCVVEGKVIKTDLQKVLRYYISHKGCKIIKENKSDGRQIQVVAGKWMQTVLNTMPDVRPSDDAEYWKSWDVNDEFYLDKIYQEIGNVQQVMSNQLTLF